MANRLLKISVGVAIAFCLASCANQAPAWRWEKRGSTEYDFNIDSGQCKAQGFAGTGGMLTMGTIMIIDSCMQGKGWYKVANR